MATATATAEVVPTRTSRWTYLLAYLALVIVAEILIAIPGPPAGEGRPLQPIGLGMHILLVFTLMFLSVLLQAKDARLASLLVAVSLASLVRVFSLAVPRFAFLATPGSNVYNTIPWLGLVSAPLLVSVAAVAYVQGLRPRDLGLLIHRWQEVPLQLALAMTGIPLGLLEIAIFLATGLSEELIFRGILLKRAVEALDERYGLLYVTAIFASLHLYFLSATDMAFVFAVGLFYGFVVLNTKNLWGVILSHSLGNVILYLVAPFH